MQCTVRYDEGVAGEDAGPLPEAREMTIDLQFAAETTVSVLSKTHEADALVGPKKTVARDGSVVSYEGSLRGLERGTGDDGCWAFEGRSYETPATEADVLEQTGEALVEPSRSDCTAAAKFLFNGPFQFTAQALVALAAVYASECEGGDGVDPVVAILREAARRIAVVEALTV